MSTTTLTLIRRNLTVFFRDRGQVFFAFLAPLILLMLYVLFLGRMQSQMLAESMGADESVVDGYVYAWVLAGMVMITTLTGALAALAAFVDDRVSGRFKEFRVSPVRNTELVLGYMVSGLVIALVLSLTVLVVGSLVFGLMFDAWASAAGYAQAVGYIVLLCLLFASLSALLVTFLPSAAAYSGLATVVGTLSGFLALAYIPVGSVSDGVASALNSLPFSQGAMVLRDPIAGPALDRLVETIPEAGRAEALSELRGFYGFDIFVGDLQLQPWMVIAVMLVLAAVFTVAASWRIGRLTKSDMR